MTSNSETIIEFKRIRELGTKMLETLIIMLQNVLDFSRQNNISIPKNIPSLLQEAINLLQELDYESLPSDEFLQRKKSDKDLTEPNLI